MFMNPVACLSSSCFYDWILLHYMNVAQFVYSLLNPDGHMGYSKFLNNAAINIHVQFWVDWCFYLFWVYTQKLAAESYGNSIV